MKKIFVFTVIVLALVLTACGSSAPTAAPVAQTEALVAATEAHIVMPFPSGRFIQSGKTDYGLLFNADGTFSVFEGDKTFVHATYAVEGNVFTETSNDGGCETNESFTYTFDGTNLTFNYVGNPDDDTACAGRHADFNNVTYALSEEANFPSGKFIQSGKTDYGLLFNADGTFSVFEGDKTFVHATYTVEGNVFTETSNDGGCETNESFTYTFDGTNLTFNYVGNPDDDTACAGRHADFNNVSYALSEESNFPSGKFIQSGKTDYGLLFNADGTFSVFEGDKTFVHATYTVEGNVFTETSNDGGCETNESFTYTFDGTKLTFNYVGNPDDDTACAGRHADFNNVTYTLSEEANFPSGKFIKSGTKDYGFIFNKDGTYARFENNVPVTRGTYNVDSNVFTETSNDGGCASNISHTYTFDGKNLTFNYVGNPEDDACGDGGRRADFDNVTYTLSEESNFPSGKFIKAGTTNYGLLFNADGTFSVFEGDKTFVHATYTVEGNVFTETSNDGGCETNESFTYTFDGTNLTFNYVGNPDDDTACAGRHADFNNVTYTLTK